jgi:hypothetical protein
VFGHILQKHLEGKLAETMPTGLVLIPRRKKAVLAAAIIEDVIYNKRE